MKPYWCIIYLISGVLIPLSFADGAMDDSGKALSFYAQAVKDGSVEAMVQSGYCYESGIGAEVDYAQAVALYEQAVKLHSLRACEGLARIYASCPNINFHNGELAARYAAVVLKKRPTDPEVLTLYARACLRNMQVDDALKAGRKAVNYAAFLYRVADAKGHPDAENALTQLKGREKRSIVDEIPKIEAHKKETPTFSPLMPTM